MNTGLHFIATLATFNLIFSGMQNFQDSCIAWSKEFVVIEKVLDKFYSLHVCQSFQDFWSPDKFLGVITIFNEALNSFQNRLINIDDQFF